MFSHALDAKHLAAGIFALQQWASPADLLLDVDFSTFLSTMAVATGEKDDTWRAQRRRPLRAVVADLQLGLTALRSLLDRCLKASGESLDAELMRCRLKQTLMLCTLVA